MADDPLTGFVRTVLGSGAPMIVLSPHLDDAVLSCGALLGWAGRRAPVTVATLFTEAAPPPYTLCARQYLRLTRARDAEELFADRREEDRRVLGLLDVDWRHVGLVDGMFRRLPRAHRGRERLSRLLPELDHVYPTDRRHLSRGRVSAYDAETLRAVGETVERCCPPAPAAWCSRPWGWAGTPTTSWCAPPPSGAAAGSCTTATSRTTRPPPTTASPTATGSWPAPGSGTSTGRPS
ncbi:hypothetical protein O1L60_03410 [Streptomyces diastatochromogenes]|nr:hypothetical protein [Streptomyces diastatochromogenes]